MKFIVVGLIGGITLWASVTSIQGAVIASGLVISEGNKKLVQHRDGGVIAELLIKDGQQVSKDDVLIRLDGRQLGSELDAIEKKLGELRLRKLRLTAEAEALPEEGLVRQLSGQLGRESNKGLDDFIRNQISLYKSRAWNHASKFEMLNKRIAALQIELKGSKDLLGAKKEELELIEKELGLLTTLEAKSLVSLSRIAPLRRERARIVGELARNKTRVAKIPEQLAEAKAEIAEAHSKRTSGIHSELQDVESEILQYVERREILLDRISRLEICAPASGYVHELTAHTKGGVIEAGATIASVVPDNATLVIDARIGVNDRDNVSSGMSARIRFTAFNQRSTPEIEGRVVWLSPDISSDEKTGHQYYLARIAVPPRLFEKKEFASVSPGMMTEILITTRPRTVASYLVKPIVDQFVRAFRDV